MDSESNHELMNPDKIIVFTDGASRGNPGPAAAGFVLNDSDGNQLQAKAFFLGYHLTNNVAEYTAFIKALEAAKEMGQKNLSFTATASCLSDR